MTSWRLFLCVSFVALTSGCGLFLDTSPPDPQKDGGVDGGPDGGFCGTASCDDGIACTVDSCEAGGCQFRPNHDLCTGDEICAPSYGCVAPTPCTSNSDCANLGGACVTWGCETTINYCIPFPDPTACDDDIACTEDVCNVLDGSCQSTAKDALCDDGATCTVDDVCSPASDDAGPDGCVRVYDHNACIDQQECTYDTCAPTDRQRAPGTGCVNLPVDNFCGQATFGCGTQVCVPTYGCAPQVLVDNTCGLEGATCDVIMGFCVGISPDLPNCDDGNPCNGVEYFDDVLGRCAHKDGVSSCGGHTDPCKEYFCDYRSANQPVCAERAKPSCYDTPPPGA